MSMDLAKKLYAKMQRSGLSAGTAHHVHRTLRNALNEAVRRDHLARNPVLQAKAPRLIEEEVEPYGIEEIQRLLKAVSERRNGARWVAALALGLRQGEALGLKWSDVDLDRGTLRIRRGRLRPRYEHGCGGTCGRIGGRGLFAGARSNHRANIHAATAATTMSVRSQPRRERRFRFCLGNHFAIDL